MYKKEFIKMYSEKYNLKEKTGEREVERFLKTLEEVLSTESYITFRNFGSFEVKKTKEREVVDPRDNTKKNYARSRKYVKFRVSRSIEDKLYHAEV